MIRSVRSLVLVLAAVVPSWPSIVAATPSEEVLAVARQLRDDALSGTRAYDLVESLTVEAGPRLAGSAGDRAGVEWGVRTLNELGFDAVRAEPVTVPHWVRGAASGTITAPHPQPVALAALGGSIGTPEGGIEAEVLRVGSLDEVDTLTAAEVAGKIVFYDQRMESTRDGSGYGRTVPIRSQGAIRAGRLGAVAVLIRSVGTSTHRLPHTGAMRYVDDVPKIPAAALSTPDADLLAAQVRTGKPVRFRLELGCRYLADGQSANVIGEIRGHERPEEIVLLGAHLDSWDLGTGAVDDGAGVAIVIETARRIAALPTPPARTIRVVLFANEEFGLSGARAYAQEHADEIPNHVLAAESDLGGAAVWSFRSRVAEEALPTIEAITELLEPLSIEYRGNTTRGGADLSPLREHGVAFASLDQDARPYFEIHHSANDTLAKLSRRELDQNVAAYATLTWVAAATDVQFGPYVEP